MDGSGGEPGSPHGMGPCGLSCKSLQSEGARVVLERDYAAGAHAELLAQVAAERDHVLEVQAGMAAELEAVRRESATQYHEMWEAGHRVQTARWRRLPRRRRRPGKRTPAPARPRCSGPWPNCEAQAVAPS